jgi:hypothetical protein
MSPAPQSNQNAGADAKPCPWCQLWNAAFAASQLPVFVPGCKRSAEIYLGDYLGPERRAWRREQWHDNDTIKDFLKPGAHDANGTY